MMRELIQQPKWQWTALIISFIAGIVGVWGFGETLDLAARQLLGLSLDTQWYDYVLPVIILTVSFIIGNAILVYGVMVPRVWMKTLIISMSVVLPCILEVVHLTILGISVMNDFLAVQFPDYVS